MSRVHPTLSSSLSYHRCVLLSSITLQLSITRSSECWQQRDYACSCSCGLQAMLNPGPLDLAGRCTKQAERPAHRHAASSWQQQWVSPTAATANHIAPRGKSAAINRHIACPLPAVSLPQLPPHLHNKPADYEKTTHRAQPCPANRGHMPTGIHTSLPNSPPGWC